MQKFFTDKPKLFECNISVDGANLNETKARLILEFPNNRNFLFHGNIDSNGKCEVMIPALKELKEGEGNVLLEVIADSTFFESWNDKFKLETSKKIRVEVVSSDKPLIKEDKKTPQVSIITEEIKEDVIFNNFKKYITENRLNINTIIKNKQEFFSLLHNYKKTNNATKEDVVYIVEELKREVKSNR